MADVSTRTFLVSGDEEFLVGRAVDRIVDEVRQRDAGTEVVSLVAAELTAVGLDEAFAPSLFGEARVVVLRDAQECDKAVHERLLALAGDVPDEMTFVVTHAGGAKGKALLDGLRTRATVVDYPPVRRPSERAAFVQAEAELAGGRLQPRAAYALLDAVGSDLRELSAAAQQLVADGGGGPIDEAVVRRYFRGRADATGFAVADKAVEGDVAGALELLRWGVAVGLAPVLVTSAVASSVRGIARVAAAGRAPTAQLARQLGMPAWKVERIQRQASGWRPDGLAKALLAVAEADAMVKGGGDPGYAVERLVLSVSAARGR